VQLDLSQHTHKHARAYASQRTLSRSSKFRAFQHNQISANGVPAISQKLIMPSENLICYNENRVASRARARELNHLQFLSTVLFSANSPLGILPMNFTIDVYFSSQLVIRSLPLIVHIASAHLAKWEKGFSSRHVWVGKIAMTSEWKIPTPVTKIFAKLEKSRRAKKMGINIMERAGKLAMIIRRRCWKTQPPNKLFARVNSYTNLFDTAIFFLSSNTKGFSIKKANFITFSSNWQVS
jgi:hypothetical protein